MTKPGKAFDEVQAAKSISKLTRVPLPRVAQVLQKYDLKDRKSIDKALADCQQLAAEQLNKDLKKIFMI